VDRIERRGAVVGPEAAIEESFSENIRTANPPDSRQPKKKPGSKPGFARLVNEGAFSV
jgi:hypothetical protein